MAPPLNVGGRAMFNGECNMTTLVTLNRKVRQNKTTKVQVPFTIKLDFAGVPAETIQDMAADQIVIALQGAARRAMEADDNKLSFATIVNNMLNTTVSVKKFVENARAPAKSAPVKISEAFAKLDANTRKALLAELSKTAK